jgi:predicted alpha/beta superfamily hydrolase
MTWTEASQFIPWLGLIGTIAVGLWRISSTISKKDTENDLRHAATEKALAESILMSRSRHDRTDSAITTMAMSINKLAESVAEKSAQLAIEHATLQERVNSHSHTIDRMLAALESREGH